MKQLQTMCRDGLLSKVTPARWGLLPFVALLSLMLTGLTAQAADYTFSATSTTFPAGCSYVSAGSYTCTVLTLAASDTVTMVPNAPATPATINVETTFTATDASANTGGLASNLNIVVVGTVAVTNTLVNANVSSVAAVDINPGSKIGGNLSATTPTGVITLGANTTVAGYLSTTDGAVTVGVGSQVLGSLTTVAGVVTLGADTRVGGDVTTVAGAINIGIGGAVGGLVRSTGAGVVTLGANVTVGAGVGTYDGAITLGDGSRVGASVASTGGGVLTIGALVTVSGDVSTAVGAINIGDASSVCGNVGTTGAGVITLTTNVSVGGGVNSIAGAVTIGAGSTVQDSITITGAGVMTLTSVKVGGNLFTFTGAITATDSLVRGTVTEVNVLLAPQPVWANQTELVLPPPSACVADLSATASYTPASVFDADTTTLTLTVTNAGTGFTSFTVFADYSQDLLIADTASLDFPVNCGLAVDNSLFCSWNFLAPGSISFAIPFVAFADTTTRTVDTLAWVVGDAIDLNTLDNYALLAALTVIAPCTAATTDDNNACTLDACDPLTGIVTHTPVATDDGNACTIDGCDPITGVFHTPVSIDDGNVCTIDACDTTTGAITHVLIVAGPVVSGTTSPQTFPAGTTSITLTGTLTDQVPSTHVLVNDLASPVTSTSDGATPPTFTASFSVSVSVLEGTNTFAIAGKGLCDNTTAPATQVLVTVSTDVCAPAVFEQCMATQQGSVFYIDLVNAAGKDCLLQCTCAGAGLPLICDPTTITCAP